jgi:hypothetical protein
MVGGLTTGRLLIAQGAIDAMKIGLTIALRYSAARPQVRPGALRGRGMGSHPGGRRGRGARS